LAVTLSFSSPIRQIAACCRRYHAATFSFDDYEPSFSMILPPLSAFAATRFCESFRFAFDAIAFASHDTSAAISPLSPAPRLPPLPSPLRQLTMSWLFS